MDPDEQGHTRELFLEAEMHRRVTLRLERSRGDAWDASYSAYMLTVAHPNAASPALDLADRQGNREGEGNRKGEDNCEGNRDGEDKGEDKGKDEGKGKGEGAGEGEDEDEDYLDYDIDTDWYDRTHGYDD
ncbi:hypothetical protein K466DRAFT_606799 [Polyporus arcularius HHB13444]|uniref:Uncharacterized protein n=1 Tax=Polyporus arcularius HHB13444 TaxID=1314778 RepID=A0A5C3NN25_9APHY|nr:hypothetical protein K466DRAFT_606799 [Polyporus arcularius HHB13444]